MFSTSNPINYDLRSLTRKPVSAQKCMQNGFTLIELIVVVAIVALLMSLLFTVISLVLHQSRVSSDMSNLRSLQTAHYNYAIDS